MNYSKRTISTYRRYLFIHDIISSFAFRFYNAAKKDRIIEIGLKLLSQIDHLKKVDLMK